jgi:hypothetical protein
MHDVREERGERRVESLGIREQSTEYNAIRKV